jgi:uncharacterized membrane protein
MVKLREYLIGALATGLLVILPLYLAILLLLKAIGSLAGLVKPFAAWLPDWLPRENLVALLLLLFICLIVGIIVRTPAGKAARDSIERSLFERIPGYALFRSLSQQLASQSRDNVWKPALVEIEEALVPAFIIEEFADGRYTVFVPSVPTPLAGAVYILESPRVHPIDVPFTQAVKTITHWGQGSRELAAAMEQIGQQAPLKEGAA